MRKHVFFIALLLLAAASGSLAQGGGLVKNGGFDGDPATTGWTVETAEAGVASQKSDGNPGGYVWLNHNGGPTDPAVSQVLNGLKAGEEYLISGDYRAGKTANTYATPGKPLFAIDIDGKELKQYPMPAAKDNPKRGDDVTWRPFSVMFKATKPSHTLRLRGEINGADGDVALDNISVAPALPDRFKVHAFSVHEGKVADAGDYWLALRDKDSRARILSQKQLVDGAKWMEVERVVVADDVFAFKVTSAGADHYLVAHDDKEVHVDKATAGSLPEGAKFKAVAPLTSAQGAGERNYRSFESVKFPGHYLRHQSYILFVHKPDDSELFKQDASFLVQGQK